jgi:hypothetical protein
VTPQTLDEACMHFELKFSDMSGRTLQLRNYDPELDDVRSILSDVCRSVERDGQFVMSGFGQEQWPVDVGTDLMVFLEQLPEIICAISAGMPAELNFYEQGVERTLTFIPDGERYFVSCVSQTEWIPNPAVEQINRETLQKMLLAVEKEFIHLVNKIAPELSKHPWMKSWLESMPPP